MASHVFLTPLVATAKIFVEVLIVGGAGVLFWRKGALDDSSVRSLSRMCFLVFSPALLLANGEAFTPQSLGDWSLLVVACVVHMGVGGLLAALVSRAAKLQDSERRMVTLACSFHNMSGLPFVFVDCLSRTWPSIMHDTDALQRGYGMIFVYMIPWNAAMFSLGLLTIRKHQEVVPAAVEGEASGLVLGKAAVSAPVTESAALVRHQQACPDEEGWSQTMRSDKSDGELVLPKDVEPVGPTVGAAETMAAAEDQRPKATATMQEGKPCSAVVKEAFWTWVQTPATVALLVAIFVGSLPSLRGTFFGEDAPLEMVPGGLRMLGLISPPASTIVNAAGISRAAGLRNGDEKTQALAAPCFTLSTRALIILSSVKLVLTPLVCFAGTTALMAAGALGDLSRGDPLFYFLLLVESAMPSAQTLVVLYEVEGHKDAATRLSSAYISQYLASCVTMAGWVMAALYILGVLM